LGKSGWVSLGMDARKSSPTLKEALIQGLNEGGLSVLDVGMVPTPAFYYSLFELNVVGGLMITASHNPPNYNGFKVAVERETISGNEIQRLYQTFLKAKNPGKKAQVKEVDVLPAYLARLEEEFLYLKDLPKLKIAVDSGNGNAGPVVLSLFPKLGVELIPLFCEPDGDFPNHHPDPTVPRYLADLVSVVKRKNCDFGLAFDGDVDRLGAVDEKGEMVYGDRLLLLFAQEVLRENRGATVVSEVKCSQILFDKIEEWGGQPIMWKAGHSLIKKKMKEEKALLGGEMSGHYFFADKYYGFDDGIYAACRLIELVKKAKEKSLPSFSSLFEGIPFLFSTPEIRIDCADEAKNVVVENFAKQVRELNLPSLKLRQIITVDGVRAVYDKGWALVRKSNTQPALVLRFEAADETILGKIKAEVLRVIECIKEEICP
jgi:phosphomannomutase/phosphoglucomutase